MQAWDELYIELAEKAAEIEGIKWVDLWHNQVGFLEEEHAFPAPAIFLAFRSLDIEDMAELMQNVRLQVEVYLFYETFADTYKGAVNQQSALSFLKMLTDINVTFHGKTGNNYNEMRRVGFSAVDTGSTGNLYQVVFECTLLDETCKKVYHDAETEEIDIERGIDDAVDEDYQLPVFNG
jgi:hypothetical protein